MRNEELGIPVLPPDNGIAGGWVVEKSEIRNPKSEIPRS